MNYWSNYPKFMVSLLKATYGNAATPENDFGYAWLPKVDGNYSWLYIFDDMYRGNSTRAGRHGAGAGGLHHLRHEPGRAGPELEEDGGRAVEAQVDGRGRERRDRDGAVLEGAQGCTRASRRRTSRPRCSCCPRRASPRRTARSPTPRAGCSGSGRRWIRRGRPRADQEIVARHLPRGSRPVPQGGRRAARSDPQLVLVVLEPEQPGPGRGAQGDERQGAGRRPRRQGSDEGPASGRPAGRRVRRAARRRLDDVRQLAALRRLHRGGQQRPAAQHRRSERPRHVPPVGLLVAGQPAHHVQPRVGRRRGQAVGRAASRHPVERRRPGSETSRTSRPTRRQAPTAPSSCCPRASAGCSARRSTTARSPSTTRRSRRRSTTRSTRRSPPTRCPSGSRATRTSTARRRTSRSSARRTG